MDGCPCGSGTALDECCGPLVHDGLPALTAEQLMRSRYTAFALQIDEHLWRTWHPRTRPSQIDTAGVSWEGLRILEVVDGAVDQSHGIVEFEARHTTDGRPGVMRERSVFERRGGRWTYVDGTGPTG